MAFDPDRAEARIVRDLRAEILSKVPDQPRLRPWSIALVALDPGSDVGVIAANLAVSFALLDRRTMIIEADFSGPLQSELFCIDADVGLVNVFQDPAQVDRAIYRTAIDRLEVVPLGSGDIVSNVDAVARKSLIESLDVLLRQADVVIIPTSGLSTGSLATALADVDLVVPVARRAKTKMRDLKAFVAMTEAQGVNTCGIVLSN
jgi:Mrp family chromosome partitioning ATPase